MSRPVKAAAAVAAFACLGIFGAAVALGVGETTTTQTFTFTGTVTVPTVTQTQTVTVTVTGGTTTTEPPTTTTEPPPPAPSGFIRGHSSHGLSSTDLAGLKARARLDAYRYDTNWPNSSAAITDFSGTDATLRNASLGGVKTMLLIGDYWPKNDPVAYGNRMAQMASRYGPAGTFWAANPSLTPVTLMLEVFNEPWLNGVSASTLAQMTAQSVQKVHAVAPSVQVGPNIDGAGTTVSYTDSFIAAYPAGVPKPDFISSHPYGVIACGTGTACPDGQQFRFDRILLMRDHAVARGWAMPFLASEWGWSSPWDVSEAKQAQYAREGFEKLKAWGALGLFYYTGDRSCVNPGGTPASGCGREGQYPIRYNDGSDRPAVAAIGQANP